MTEQGLEYLPVSHPLSWDRPFARQNNSRRKLLIGGAITLLLLCLASLRHRSSDVTSANFIEHTPSFTTLLNQDKVANPDTPPMPGCEATVSALQNQLVDRYSKEFEGVKHVSILGFPAHENKGDAALWLGERILLSMLGITVHYSCDYWDLDPWHHRFCDQSRFKEELIKHKGQNALILHAGGNFNNFYKPQADRVMAVKEFTGTPVKSFGQTIEMDNGPGTKETVDTFNQHGDVMLAARDRNSYEWLLEAFPKSDMAAIDGSNGVRSILTPDVAFMIGNRPDIRLNTKKTHDVLLLIREDVEKSKRERIFPTEKEGVLDLPSGRRVTYRRTDWLYPTPELRPHDTQDQIAFKRTMNGMRLLASAEFIITDRLHGHILSTILGMPHVALDTNDGAVFNKNNTDNGKLFNLHHSWLDTCNAARLANSETHALEYADKYFEVTRS